MAKRGNNEGTIYQLQNGRWRAQVSMNGKRSSITKDTRRECQDWIREQLNRADDGYVPLDNTVTVAVYLARWLKRHGVTVKEHTLQQYRRIIDRHVIPHIGRYALHELTLALMDDYYSQLQQDGVGVHSIHFVDRILHKAFADAVRYQYLHRNPTKGVRLPKIPHKEMQIWEEPEVTQFLATAAGTRFEALYQLAIVTGMREGELLGLQWKDIQWHRGMLQVRRQAVYRTSEGMVFTTPKTKAGLRTIKLGESTLQQLRAHRERQQATAQYVGTDWSDLDVVFSSARGKPIYQTVLNEEYKKVLAASGVKKIRFHDLRHTAASLMLNYGVPVVVVSKILGHANPSITMNIYAHLITSQQHQAAQIMEELVVPEAIEIPASAGLHTVAHE